MNYLPRIKHYVVGQCFNRHLQFEHFTSKLESQPLRACLLNCTFDFIHIRLFQHIQNKSIQIRAFYISFIEEHIVSANDVYIVYRWIPWQDRYNVEHKVLRQGTLHTIT